MGNWFVIMFPCVMAPKKKEEEEIETNVETECKGTKQRQAKPTEQSNREAEGKKKTASKLRQKKESIRMQKACANHFDKLTLANAKKKSKIIKRHKKTEKKESKKQKENENGTKTRCLETNLFSMQRHFLTSVKHKRHLFRKWKTPSAVLAIGSIALIPHPPIHDSKEENKNKMTKKIIATKIKIKTYKQKQEKKFCKMNESGDTVDTESKHVEKRSGMREVDFNQPHTQFTVKARWQQTNRQKRKSKQSDGRAFFLLYLYVNDDVPQSVYACVCDESIHGTD